MKKIAAFILFIGVLDSISAQSTLTLDSCRALALSNNKELRISAEKITAAHYEKKAAFTNYLPKIAAIGTYMRTQKEISLLSDEQKGVISQIGTTAQGSIQETFQQLAASNPLTRTNTATTCSPHPRYWKCTEQGRTRFGRCAAHRHTQYVCRSCNPYPTHLHGRKNCCLQ